MNLGWALLIGVFVGFIGGMFGKGGSAIATPLLFIAGAPSIVAVASPLPATIPATVLAAWQYQRAGQLDRRLFLQAIAYGAPATVAGAALTAYVSGDALIVLTEVLMLGMGLRLLFKRAHAGEDEAPRTGWPVAAVCISTGFSAGLLANSGGFLLAPLFITVLRRPVKTAFGTSLATAATLAIPGTVVHAGLGHVDWRVTVAFALGSIPLAQVGARVAIAATDGRLERLFGAFLATSAIIFLGG